MRLKSLCLVAAAMVACGGGASAQEGAGYSLPVHAGGKITKDSGGYAYQWPAVYFESAFQGTDVTLMFNDDTTNYNVLLDGREVMVVRKPGQTHVTVRARDWGPHTIRVEKRSETQYATGHFLGFSVPDKTGVLPAPVRARQIEFIGDSLTVGYGNTSAYTQCTPDEIFETTDSQEGFGPIVARHYNADYQINAFSGLGMVRNYGGYEHDRYRMPMLYSRAIFENPEPAAEPDWHPQVIVVGMGGNDFSTSLKDGEKWKTQADLRADYEATYIRFVKDLRAKNPDAFLILTSPDGRGDYTDGTTDVFNTLKAGGETRMDRLTIPSTQNTGCNGHPNTRDDANIAQMFMTWFDAHSEVWQGK